MVEYLISSFAVTLSKTTALGIQVRDIEDTKLFSLFNSFVTFHSLLILSPVETIPSLLLSHLCRG